MRWVLYMTFLGKCFEREEAASLPEDWPWGSLSGTSATFDW